MRHTLTLFLAVAAALPTFAQTAQHHHQAEKLHRDPKAYIAALENPKRDAYQKPDEVMAALGLRQGEIVADIGSGSGYFTLRLAQAVGPSGRVYGVDVSPDMIVHLNRRLRDLGVRNVTTILAAPDDPFLPDAAIDRFFFCDVWHHVDDQPKYLASMKRMLKPGGQVVMIDFHKKPLPVGPPLEMKIAREDLVAQMQKHGYKLVKEHTFLPHQYFIVFEVAS